MAISSLKLVRLGRIALLAPLDPETAELAVRLGPFFRGDRREWKGKGPLVHHGAALHLEALIKESHATLPIFEESLHAPTVAKRRAEALETLDQAAKALAALSYRDKRAISIETAKLLATWSRGTLGDSPTTEAGRRMAAPGRQTSVGAPATAFWQDEALELLGNAVKRICIVERVQSGQPPNPKTVVGAVESLGCLYVAMTGETPDTSKNRGRFRHFVEEFLPALRPGTEQSKCRTEADRLVRRLKRQPMLLTAHEPLSGQADGLEEA